MHKIRQQVLKIMRGIIVMKTGSYQELSVDVSIILYDMENTLKCVDFVSLKMF